MSSSLERGSSRISSSLEHQAVFLPAYGTRAMMPLDQQCHQQMSQLWKDFKQSWSVNGAPLTIFIALRAVRSFTDRALDAEVATTSWKRVGIMSGAAVNRDMLLVTRSSEIFSTVRDKERPSPSSAAVNILLEVSPKKTKCKGCSQLLSNNMRKCYNCSLENPEFDAEAFKIHQQGFRSGWKKQRDVEDVVAANSNNKELTEAEKALLSQVDDLTKELLLFSLWVFKFVHFL